MQHELSHEAARLSALLESAPGPALIVDRRHRVRAVNAALRARVPRRAGTVGRYCYELLHGRRRPCAPRSGDCPLRACLATAAPVPAVHYHVAGRRRLRERILLQPIVADDGRVAACLATLEPLQPPGDRRPQRVGTSVAAVASVRAQLPRLARGQGPILLEGEPGTGKASVARALHRLRRSRGAFEERSVCELSPKGLEDLLSRLPRGASAYLSDLHQLEPEAQDTLWRWLNRTPRGVRLIGGSERDLEPLVASDRFREDLAARLCASRLRLPPLRDRPDELRGLATRLLRQMEGPGRRLSLEALDRLRSYPFPGNLDELAQVLRYASLMASGPIVRSGDLPSWVGATPSAAATSGPRGRRPRGSIGH